MFKILEISEKQKGGRVPIKIALLKIHTDKSETNTNGIHWEEEYVLKNIDSAKNMGIFAEFADSDKVTPVGHGLTGFFIGKNGIKEPKFENSEQVGMTTEDVSIQEINVDGQDIKALVADGYLSEHRYPEFVKWVRESKQIGNVDTSIECVGLKANNGQIIYAEGDNATQEYRTPKEFEFSGTAILSVEPADKNAIVLEVAEKRKKEEIEMDEKALKELIATTITECNDKSKEFTAQISELNSQIEAKDATIAELNASIEKSQAEIETLKTANETSVSEINSLKEELGKLQAEKKINELNAALSSYTEDEQKFAEAEINAFKENPLEGDISLINSKICTGIVAKQKEDAKIAEINSAKKTEPEIIDIFSGVSEINEDMSDEDTNIF